MTPLVVRNLHKLSSMPVVVVPVFERSAATFEAAL